MYSAGVKMAVVARGEADVYVNTYSNFSDWDICAGHILVTEAGGVVSGLRRRGDHLRQARLQTDPRPPRRQSRHSRRGRRQSYPHRPRLITTWAFPPAAPSQPPQISGTLNPSHRKKAQQCREYGCGNRGEPCPGSGHLRLASIACGSAPPGPQHRFPLRQRLSGLISENCFRSRFARRCHDRCSGFSRVNSDRSLQVFAILASSRRNGNGLKSLS